MNINILGLKITASKFKLTTDKAHKITVEAQFQKTLNSIYRRSERGIFYDLFEKDEISNEAMLLLLERGFNVNDHNDKMYKITW